MSIQVSLKNLHQFESFRPHLLEQRITPEPRNFNPIPVVEFSGMEKDVEYQIGLRFDRLSNTKFLFRNQNWIVDARLRLAPKESPLHPVLLLTGQQLMKSSVQLTVKLSNNPKRCDVVALDMMMKYQCVLVVSKVARDENGVPRADGDTEQEFKFDCLQFITVSKYQSPEIAVQKSKLTRQGVVNARRSKHPYSREKSSSETSSSDQHKSPSSISTTSMSSNPSPAPPLPPGVSLELQNSPQSTTHLQMVPPPTYPNFAPLDPFHNFYGAQHPTQPYPNWYTTPSPQGQWPPYDPPYNPYNYTPHRF